MTQTQHVSFEIFGCDCLGLGSALEKKLNVCQAQTGSVTVSQNVTSYTAMLWSIQYLASHAIKPGLGSRILY